MQNVRGYNYNNGPMSTFNLRCVPDLPRDALVWLRKYGLSDEEVAHFVWESDRQRLMYIITRNDKVVFAQGRRFGDDGPKYLTWGTVPWDPPDYFGDKGTVIFVEDVVSAIKVGRHATGVPVFGSYVPFAALRWAHQQGRGVAIWLDPNKFREGLKQALKATAMGAKTHVIGTAKDPKEHTDAEILEAVGRVI